MDIPPRKVALTASSTNADTVKSQINRSKMSERPTMNRLKGSAVKGAELWSRKRERKVRELLLSGSVA